VQEPKTQIAEMKDSLDSRRWPEIIGRETGRSDGRMHSAMWNGMKNYIIAMRRNYVIWPEIWGDLID
jgi:hypothetical protein